MPFNTYIDDKDMIPVLLDHDWMIWKDTWTDCSYETYVALKKVLKHNGNAIPLSGFPNKRSTNSKTSTII